MSSYKVFSGAPNYAGYIESWKGGRASIRVARADANTQEALAAAVTEAWSGADKSAKDVNKGFMVNSYQVSFQRTVQNQYFLNIEDAVAILGRGQGTVTLTGLVGSAEDFATLLGASKTGGTTGTITDDFCKPLIIMISGTTQVNDCATRTAANGTGDGTTFICSNVIINNFAVTGQTQADGAEMQVANITATFTNLEMKSGKPNGSKK